MRWICASGSRPGCEAGHLWRERGRLRGAAGALGEGREGIAGCLAHTFRRRDFLLGFQRRKGCSGEARNATLGWLGSTIMGRRPGLATGMNE